MQRIHTPFDAGTFLALDARVVRSEYPISDRKPKPYAEVGGAAVVSVCGPLARGMSEWCDSYDAVCDRVGAALSSGARAVVLAIDSPGGDAQGNVEASRRLRDMATRAGKPLVAWTDGVACSAGYALACAATRIYATPTAVVGSIGTIAGRADITKMLADFGIRFDWVTSGERKADGYPGKQTDPAALAALQVLVDDFSSMFFAWVHESRPALSVEAIKALEAGIFVGAHAQRVGLVDGIATLEGVIAQTVQGAVAVRAAPPAKTKTKAARTPRQEKRTMAIRNETESCDLAALREAMGMMEEPAQEVVDAAAARIAESAGAEGQPDEDKEKDGEETKALRAELAVERQARASLTDTVTKLQAQLAPLQALAAAQAERDREEAVDAEMTSRGFPTHTSTRNEKGETVKTPTERRQGWQAIAKEHGLPAALASIKAAHVPPTGAVVPPTSPRPTGAPESMTASSEVTDQSVALAQAQAAIRAERPTLSASDPEFHREALARARKDHPKAFSRAAAAGKN